MNDQSLLTLCFCFFSKASRVTTTSDIGRIHLSETSWQLLKDSPFFETTPRGKIEMKVWKFPDMRKKETFVFSG
jgi:hypothetical protein